MDVDKLLKLIGGSIFTVFIIMSMGAAQSLDWLYQQTKILLRVMSTSNNLKALSLALRRNGFERLVFLVSRSTLFANQPHERDAEGQQIS